MILVTGGTGLVGSHLLYTLLQQHEKVRAVHRASSDTGAIRAIFRCYTDDPDSVYDRIEWMEANLNDLPALSKAFEGITNVYHSAAYISFDPKNYRKLKKSNVEGTANVVNLCLKNGVEKLCYVSSVATLGSSVNGSFIDEETHWNAEENNSVYAISKYGAEMEVWRGTQEGLPAVIVNPGVILGEGYRNSGSGGIPKAVAKGVPFYTSGSVGMVDVADVVHVMVRLMESDISGERFVLVSENISYKDLFTQLSEFMGKKPPKKELAKWKLVFLSKLEGIASRLFGMKRNLPRSTVNSLYTASNYNASKVKEFIEFNFTPVEKTLRRVAKHYSMES